MRVLRRDGRGAGVLNGACVDVERRRNKVYALVKEEYESELEILMRSLLQPLALTQEHEEPLLDTDRDFTMSIS